MSTLVSSIFRRCIAVAVALGFFLLIANLVAQRNLSRGALWEVVHNVCVPQQTRNHSPMPCVQVDLSDGEQKGFAVLKDPRGLTHFLLIPTAPIPGIESPEILAPDATNYFAAAWEARHFVFDALGKTLPRDDVALAINSATSRSQDQLHIHIDCVRRDVRDDLHQNEAMIADHWAPFQAHFSALHYTAMWVPGETLGPNNPFQLLAADLPGASRDMGKRTLVAVGFTRADGAAGFVLLTDHTGTSPRDLAYGEGLLDHACRIDAQ